MTSAAIYLDQSVMRAFKYVLCTIQDWLWTTDHHHINTIKYENTMHEINYIHTQDGNKESVDPWSYMMKLYHGCSQRILTKNEIINGLL